MEQGAEGGFHQFVEVEAGMQVERNFVQGLCRKRRCRDFGRPFGAGNGPAQTFAGQRWRQHQRDPFGFGLGRQSRVVIEETSDDGEFGIDLMDVGQMAPRGRVIFQGQQDDIKLILGHQRNEGSAIGGYGELQGATPLKQRFDFLSGHGRGSYEQDLLPELYTRHLNGGRRGHEDNRRSKGEPGCE